MVRMATYLDELLAALRKDARSSPELSKIAKVHQVNIRQIRNGSKLPNHETATRLAKCLGYEIVLKKRKSVA